MTGRLRYVLAAAFVALFFLLPKADDEHIAFLKTKAWLVAEGGPFDKVAITAKGAATRLPPMAVEFLGPSATIDGRTAIQRRAEWTRRLARVAREWSRQPSANRKVDESLTPSSLQVRVGDWGFLATFTASGLETPLTLTLETREGAARRAAAGKPQGPTDGYYPDRWSLLPAFLAIVLAILTAKVIPSLLLGCLAGAWLFARGPIDGTVHLVRDVIVKDVLLSEFNVEIMAFVVFLFMCVGVMTRSGGIQGMVDVIQRYAKGPVSAQVCSYVIGLLIFFDDYSNCVIAGSTMRPLTDRNRVSREKLAYIVDSTAAPIAGISIFSTWVAYEISMFAPQLPEVTDAAGQPYAQTQGMQVFMQTLPFRLYCIFTLVMVVLTIVLRREFGSMLAAERRAAQDGQPVAADARPMISKGFDRLEPEPGTRCLARNALVPIGVLVVLTLVLIFAYGHYKAGDAADGLPLFDRLQTYLGHTESQKALFWASLCALLVAAAMTLVQRTLSLKEVVDSAVNSARALGFAVIILILAWAIGDVCRDDVGTSHFLTAAFGSSFSPWLLPSILFVLSALVSFSTGTSYGTMAILLPNVIVWSHQMGATEGSIGGTALMLLTIGAVLEGSIFGDHCSPISDTTVLSSVATGSDHLHHVRTQAPYALLVMLVAMVTGYLPLAFFGPEYPVLGFLPLWLVSLLVGAAAITATLLLLGRSPDPRPAPSTAPQG